MKKIIKALYDKKMKSLNLGTYVSFLREIVNSMFGWMYCNIKIGNLSNN